MGLDDHQVDLNRWQLEIEGQVHRPLKLTYNQIVRMPSIQRNVLLICPGFFAYHARWEGISVAKLLQTAEVGPGVTHVTFSGPDGTDEKSQRFPLGDILADKVFLAYRVNDNVLPKKHGFPLRVVAEDHYGGHWVKYVYKVTAIKT
jgi:sulfoxide reductase catalytic subunit YedY